MRTPGQGLDADLRAPAQGRDGNPDLNGAGRALDWFFRDRRTGGVTIGQWPNAPLLLFAGCAGVDWLFAPEGGIGTAIRLTGTLALAIWALDEVSRGANPCRRCLGAAVLAFLVWKLATAFA